MASPDDQFASASPERAIYVVGAFLLIALLSYRLGELPLMDPDEGRNGEVAREMELSNDYLLPRLNGVPYLDKPVLFFAAAAGAIELLGPTELAVRLPALLFTLATLLVIWSFARREFGSPGAWAALVATASSPFTVVFARTVIFDSALTFFVCAALISFYTAIERQAAGRQGTVWTILGWTAIGLGILTKGPVALVLPLLVCAPYAAWRRASRGVWRWSGVAAACAVLAPWLAVVEHRVPGFLHYAVVTESFERIGSGKLRRTEPIWYFIPILLLGALPWSIALLVRTREIARRFRDRNPLAVFLVLWIVIPFLFFTLSKSKSPQYVLPLIPAVGLLIGYLWKESSLSAGRLILISAMATAAVGLVFLSSVFLLPLLRGLDLSAISSARRAALLVGILATVAAGAAWSMRRRPMLAILVLAIPMLTLPMTLQPLIQKVTAHRSTRELAAGLSRHMTPGAPIILLRVYRPSLSFYLRRPVVLVTADARELTSNYIYFSSHEWIDAPASPLRSLAWFQRMRDSLSPKSIVITKPLIAEQRQLVGDRFRRISQSGSLVVLGPVPPVLSLPPRR